MNQKSRITASLLLLCIFLAASSCVSRGPRICDDKGPQLVKVNRVVDLKSAGFTVSFGVTNPDQLKRDPVVAFLMPGGFDAVADYEFKKIGAYSSEWKKFGEDSNLEKKENFDLIIGYAEELRIGLNKTSGSEKNYTAVINIGLNYLKNDPSQLNNIGSSVIIYGDDCIMVSKHQP